MNEFFRNNRKVFISVGGILGILLLGAAVVYGFLYAATPEHIRRPKFEHHHFRTQLIVDGKKVNFADDEFQQETPGACSAEIAPSPIHFHDHIDQITHIHWQGMTGGEVMKYYGWNFIGGNDNTLGYRYDKGLLKVERVPILGYLLPNIPQNANYYVYVGDENGYQKKNWNDFINQDLETFFGKKSNVPKTNSFLNWLFPKAAAHGGHDHSEQASGEKNEEELTRINNLIGNVVIFVQEKEPTDEQIKERFNNLTPLQDSTCGG